MPLETDTSTSYIEIMILKSAFQTSFRPEPVQNLLFSVQLKCQKADIGHILY
jgi:hypothetical protein